MTDNVVTVYNLHPLGVVRNVALPLGVIALGLASVFIELISFVAFATLWLGWLVAWLVIDQPAVSRARYWQPPPDDVGQYIEHIYTSRYPHERPTAWASYDLASGNITYYLAKLPDEPDLAIAWLTVTTLEECVHWALPPEDNFALGDDHSATWAPTFVDVLNYNEFAPFEETAVIAYA